ncbi:TonB-dependent receptor [bacterium]|nr:TonB-dependent receptor [bacterium]
MRRILLFMLIMAVFVLIPSLLFCQVTGKISGRVIDKDTGEPLAAANITIEGTKQGAATDLDGYYFIINVRAGKYDITASRIGYESVSISGVEVNSNLTTKLDFELSSTALTGEKVVVTAERPMVIPDATATTHITTAEQIDQQPIRNFTQVVSQQSGVVTSTGGTSWTTDGLHIRGGRGDEVAFMIDGMSAQDRLSGRADANVDVNIAAVEEVSVITGGFSPEYGQAMSGVVNVVTKEGGERPEGMFRYTSDIISEYARGRDIIELTTGGAVGFFPKLRYFFSGELYFRDNAESWYGEMSHTDRESYQLQSKLTYRFSPSLKLNLSGFLSREQYGRFGMYVGYADVDSWCSNSLKYAPPEYRSDGFRKAYQLVGTFTHTLSPSTFYELRAGTFYAQTINGHRDWGTEDDRKFWEDYDFVPWWTYTEAGNARTDDPGWTTKDENGDYYYPYGVAFASGFKLGSPCGWLERISAYDGVKFDLTSQLTRHHELKTGFDAKVHRAMRDNAQYIEYTPQVPVYEDGEEIGTEVPPEYREMRYAMYYDSYDYYPKEFAIYVQDKIEYSGFVLNGGLRFDYFDPATWRYNDLAVPYDSVTGELDTVTATKKMQISPRLGLAFPVTDKTAFHLAYGHFFQVTQFRWLYDSHNIDLYTYPGGWPIVSNPDLDPQHTVQYEVGVGHTITPDLALHATGFYKDIYHLVGTRYIRAIPRRYSIYQTEDYGNVKGLELVLRKRMGDWLSGHLAYTLQFAAGTSSDVREAYYEYISNIMPDPITGEPLQMPKIDFPLEFDQRHTISLNLNFRFPKQFGPEVVGIRPLERWNLNVLTDIGSGLPYTKEDTRGQRIGEVGAERTPWTYSTSLRVDKPFSIAGISASFFVNVTNLFNTMNVLNVYPNTGKVDDNNMTQDYETYMDQTWIYDGDQVEVGYSVSADERRDLDNNGLISKDEWYQSYVNAREDFLADPNMVSAPRNIEIGLKIDW